MMAKRAVYPELSKTASSISETQVLIFLFILSFPNLLRLRLSGMEEEGLFRRSPSTVMLKQAQEAYDRGNSHPIAPLVLRIDHYDRTSDNSRNFRRSTSGSCSIEEVSSRFTGANFP
jgi:hypothetical protein